MAQVLTATGSEYERREDGKLKHFVWLVVGPHVWGKGFTFRQAFDAATKPKTYLAFVSADPWIAVDEMGSLVYYPLDREHPHASARPYFVVALKALKGKTVEATMEEPGDTRQVVATGKHDVLDARYDARL